MEKPFSVLEVPAYIMVQDGAGTRILNINRDGTKTDAEMYARAELVAKALNRLSISAIKGVR